MLKSIVTNHSLAQITRSNLYVQYASSWWSIIFTYLNYSMVWYSCILKRIIMMWLISFISFVQSTITIHVHRKLFVVPVVFFPDRGDYCFKILTKQNPCWNWERENNNTIYSKFWIKILMPKFLYIPTNGYTTLFFPFNRSYQENQAQSSRRQIDKIVDRNSPYHDRANF